MLLVVVTGAATLAAIHWPTAGLIGFCSGLWVGLALTVHALQKRK
jgi:hypothetical protein